MAYRTVLLHVNDEGRVARLIDAAAHLASRHQSHLIGLYVIPPVPTYGTSAMGAGMITSGLNTFREEAGRIEAAFAKATREQPFTAEWRLVTAQGKGVAETVMEHGRSADLIMASQRDPSWDFHTLLDEPERLAVESGRPVLLIPYAGQFSSFGKRVTIAWNGRREAARAAFDALPLLKMASTVRILWINPQDEVQDAGDIPTAEIAAALGAPRSEMRDRDDGGGGYRCRRRAVVESGRRRLRSAGDGRLRPLAPAGVRVRRRHPPHSAEHDGTGAHVALTGGGAGHQNLMRMSAPPWTRVPMSSLPEMPLVKASIVTLSETL